MIFNHYIVAALCSLILGSEVNESSSVIYAPAFIVTPLSEAANYESAAGSGSSVQEIRPISFDSHSANAHTSEQRVTISEYTGTSTVGPLTNPSSIQGKETEYQKAGSNPSYDWFGFWGASRSADSKPEKAPKPEQGSKSKDTKANSKTKPSTQQNQSNQTNQSKQSSQSTQSSSIESSSIISPSSTSNQLSKPSSSKPGKSEDKSKASNSSLPSILYTPAY